MAVLMKLGARLLNAYGQPQPVSTAQLCSALCCLHGSCLFVCLSHLSLSCLLVSLSLSFTLPLSEFCLWLARCAATENLYVARMSPRRSAGAFFALLPARDLISLSAAVRRRWCDCRQPLGSSSATYSDTPPAPGQSARTCMHS